MRDKLQAWAGRMIMLALVALFMIGFSYTVPIDLALLAAIDMATYVDVLFGVFVMARVARISPVLAHVRLGLVVATRRLGSRVRSIRTRPTGPTAGANDDDPDWARAAA